MDSPASNADIPIHTTERFQQFKMQIMGENDYVQINEQYAVRALIQENSGSAQNRPVKSGHCRLEIFDIQRDKIVKHTDVELTFLPSRSGSLGVKLNNFNVLGKGNRSPAQIFILEELFFNAILHLYRPCAVHTADWFEFNQVTGVAGTRLFLERFHLEVNNADLKNAVVKTGADVPSE